MYWLVHGTALLRAAPEHVRPDIESETLATDSPQLHRLVQDVQNRGATIYTDLLRTNRKRPRVDVHCLTDEETFEADQLPAPHLPEAVLPLPRPAPAAAAPVGALPKPEPLAPTTEDEHEPEPPLSRQTTSDPTISSTTTLAPAISATATPLGPAISSTTTPLGPIPFDSSASTPTGIPSLPPDQLPLPDGDVELASEPDDDSHDAPMMDPVPEHRLQAPFTEPDIHPLFHGCGDKESSLRGGLGWTARRHYRFPVFRVPGPDPEMQMPPVRTRLWSMSSRGTSKLMPVAQMTSPFLLDGIARTGFSILKRSKTEHRLIRHHVVARDSLFHPSESGECPLPLQALCKDRTTVPCNHRHTDRWRTSTPAPSEALWTGRTIFKINQRERKAAEAAFNELTDGHHSYAGTREERAKDAKNLDEKNLSLSDKLLFLEAKRKELESFFTNQVWEFSSLDEAPPERVLKAHFILKWSKHPDGSPRAKARLITQGFRDPDGLAGRVDSTSPTLSRLGRTYLMSVMANCGWTNFVADISTAFL